MIFILLSKFDGGKNEAWSNNRSSNDTTGVLLAPGLAWRQSWVPKVVLYIFYQ